MERAGSGPFACGSNNGADLQTLFNPGDADTGARSRIRMEAPDHELASVRARPADAAARYLLSSVAA